MEENILVNRLPHIVSRPRSLGLYDRGISDSQPLTYESIIRGCFSNPDRSNYPEFMNNLGQSSNLYTQQHDPEYFVSLLRPGLVQEFNRAKIDLTNTSEFMNAGDREPFLQAIRNQKWHGPYKSDRYDEFYFVSLDRSGDNEYFILLQIDLNQFPHEYISLFFYKNNSEIAPGHEFRAN